MRFIRKRFLKKSATYSEKFVDFFGVFYKENRVKQTPKNLARRKNNLFQKRKYMHAMFLLSNI